LRSTRSLIQTIGRAARHINGRAILYADRITDSMQRGDVMKPSGAATQQLAHNAAHGVTPQGVNKSVSRTSLRGHMMPTAAVLTRQAVARSGALRNDERKRAGAAH
jgi:excinuclease ABC subunit B